MSARSKYEKTTEELKESKKRVSDLEYREEELERLLSRTRSSLEEKYAGSAKEVDEEMKRLKESAGRAEKELEAVKRQYNDLQAR